MVTADIEEAAEFFVLASDDNHGLAARKLAGDIVTGRSQLIDAACIQPASPEDGAEFEFQDTRIGVPRCRDREGALERRVRVVQIKNSFERSLHISDVRLCDRQPPS
jgi:hypothetical protein